MATIDINKSAVPIPTNGGDVDIWGLIANNVFTKLAQNTNVDFTDAIFVQKNGDDSDGLTPAKAFTTINAALTASAGLKPIIICDAGSYDEVYVMNAPSLFAPFAILAGTITFYTGAINAAYISAAVDIQDGFLTANSINGTINQDGGNCFINAMYITANINQGSLGTMYLFAGDVAAYENCAGVYKKFVLSQQTGNYFVPRNLDGGMTVLSDDGRTYNLRIDAGGSIYTEEVTP